MENYATNLKHVLLGLFTNADFRRALDPNRTQIERFLCINLNYLENEDLSKTAELLLNESTEDFRKFVAGLPAAYQYLGNYIH